MKNEFSKIKTLEKIRFPVPRSPFPIPFLSRFCYGSSEVNMQEIAETLTEQ
ncbi:hypothetical protein CKA32_002446 [Geitlerinema sp. FC II]|nr:hypothetical protein CKA32_002446 [Geitlerinema sp. FC II]